MNSYIPTNTYNTYKGSCRKGNIFTLLCHSVHDGMHGVTSCLVPCSFLGVWSQEGMVPEEGTVYPIPGTDI